MRANNKVRKYLIKLLQHYADRAGVLVIQKWRVDGYLLAQRLKRVFNEYAIDCCLDVGANVGQYRDFLREEVDYKGLIISYEPDPASFKILEERKKNDDNWVVFNCALGDENSMLELNIMKSSVFNSFLSPDSSNTEYYKKHNAIAGKVRIQSKRLDSEFRELAHAHGVKNVFMKMDTQGYDLKVFEGAEACLDLIRGVQTEISVMPLYKNIPLIDESIAAFREKGYEVSGMYSLSESRFPHALEFDCIFLPKGCGVTLGTHE